MVYIRLSSLQRGHQRPTLGSRIFYPKFQFNHFVDRLSLVS